jgi:hypothetical protein
MLTIDPLPALRILLLRVDDAAQLLAIGRTTMYQLIAAGEIELVHIAAVHVYRSRTSSATSNAVGRSGLQHSVKLSE